MGLKRDNALQIAAMTKHQYYYKGQSGQRGRKKSQSCKQVVSPQCTIEVNNKKVVEKMQDINSDPNIDYGYHKMTYALMALGFIINHKKVYRLMSEHQMLHSRSPRKSKVYAKYRVVMPGRPLEVLEMDIKMVWVGQYRQHAYILTILDTFTRAVLHWQVGYSMKQEAVQRAWEKVIENHLQPADMLKNDLHIEIRNDNGPQFSAKKLRGFLKENHLNQVFTHPYTPQENGHIESFHRLLDQSLSKKLYWFLGDLERDLVLFYETYNNRRIHSSIAYLAPLKFWELWNKGLIECKKISKLKRRFKLKNCILRNIIGQ